MDAGLKRKSEDQTPEDFEQRAKKSYHVRLFEVDAVFSLESLVLQNA